MSLSRWPDYALPLQPLNEQYTVEHPDTLTRTDFEQGVSRQRQNVRSASGKYNVVWPFSPVQMRVFNGWLVNELCNGAAWFLADVFTDDDYHELKVRFVKGSIKKARSGGEWIVSATLETDDPQFPTSDETAMTLITWGTTDTIQTFAANLHTAIHTTYGTLIP